MQQQSIFNQTPQTYNRGHRYSIYYKPEAPSQRCDFKLRRMPQRYNRGHRYSIYYKLEAPSQRCDFKPAGDPMQIKRN